MQTTHNLATPSSVCGIRLQFDLRRSKPKIIYIIYKKMVAQSSIFPIFNDLDIDIKNTQ